MSTQRRAVVLGGGVAGLAAAFGLRERGFAVELFESRGWLGGRAFSFVDRTTGAWLDNGPHAMLGCYRAMRRLLHRLGTEGEFARDASLRLSYRSVGGATARLRLGPLPVPLAMPMALLRLPLRGSGRLRALFGMAAALVGASADWSVADWLQRRRQHGDPDSFLWRPLCRAIMNVEPELASAALFLRVLREAFGGSAAAAAFWLPRRSWGEILGAAAERALPAAGVALSLSRRVAALTTRAGAIDRIVFQDQSSSSIGSADLVVSALPWHSLARLLPAAAPGLQRLPASPIVSVHFAFEPPKAALPDEGPLVALVDGDPFHFLYRTPGHGPERLALLSGGNRTLDGCTVAEIEAVARAQLARHYPGFPVDAPAAVRVAKEALATFVAGPGSAALRPAPGRSPAGPANLLVCGDWTACGLPATLEGAARSAEMALTSAGGGSPASLG